MVRKYRNYSIPEELAERVERVIKERKDLGYVSVSEFAKDAIRTLLKEYDSG